MNEVATAPKKRRSLLIVSSLLLGIPLLMLLLTAIALLLRDSAGNRQANAKLAEIAQDGFPIDNETLAKFHESITSDEFTAEWVALINEAQSGLIATSTRPLPIVGEADFTAIANLRTDKRVEEFLLASTAYRGEIYRLAKMEQAVRFPIEFDSFNTILQNSNNLRQLARITKLSGMYAIATRNEQQLVRDVEAMFGIGRVSSGEPFIISQLICVSIDGMGIELIRCALREGMLNRQSCEQLLKLVDARCALDDQLKVGLIGERAMAIPIFLDGAQASQSGIPRPPFRSWDTLTYLEMMENYIDAAETEDLTAAVEENQRLERLFESKVVNVSWWQKWDTMLTALTVPALNKLSNTFVRQAVHHRMATLALHLRLFELQNDGFPSALDDLSAQLLQENWEQLQPVGGKPFGYRIVSEQAELWSCDLQDDFETVPEPPNVIPFDDHEDHWWAWQIAPSEQ